MSPFPPPTLRVLYFAQAAEATGCRAEQWEIAGPLDAAAFWNEAIRRHPALEAFRGRCRLAVNQAFLTQSDAAILPASEVAVIPPVSGG